LINIDLAFNVFFGVLSFVGRFAVISKKYGKIESRNSAMKNFVRNSLENENSRNNPVISQMLKWGEVGGGYLW
jgi:hypothetical protein